MKYRSGNEVARRKHLWLPCAIDAKFEEMSEEEQVRILRETYWLDDVTNSEWPALLNQPEATRYARSRLKKKLVGWWMVLGRVALLNYPLFKQSIADAQRLYHQQIGTCHPILADCCVCEQDVAPPVQRNGKEVPDD